MNADVWGAVAAIASAIAAIAATVVAFIAWRLQRTIHRESGRMLAISGYPVSWADQDSSISRAAINVQLRNPGRMDTNVESVVVSFPPHQGRGGRFYPYVWHKQFIAAGDGLGLMTPFYVCEQQMVECRVVVTMGDGQVLSQPLPCYEPSSESDGWPGIEG